MGGVLLFPWRWAALGVSVALTHPSGDILGIPNLTLPGQVA